MGRRHKGALSDAAIDREWPHQVALHSELWLRHQYDGLRATALRLGCSPRGRQVTKMEATGYEALYLVTCFRTREAARAFIDECGGRHFDPIADREKRRRSVWTYREWGDPADRYPEIVARLEVARSWEPKLDADIAMLLGLPKPVRFTREQAEVEAFLCGFIPRGEWAAWQHPEIDAKVRHDPDGAWRHARENVGLSRDNAATALTLAFLRGWRPVGD